MPGGEECAMPGARKGLVHRYIGELPGVVLGGKCGLVTGGKLGGKLEESAKGQIMKDLRSL